MAQVVKCSKKPCVEKHTGMSVYPAQYALQPLQKGDSEDESDDGEVVKISPEPMPENLAGMTIAVAARDLHRMALGAPPTYVFLKVSRITLTCALLWMAYSAQIFLIVATKTLVTPYQVSRTRKVYNDYETMMYTDDAGVAHTYTTANGYNRGLGEEFFEVSRFSKFSDDDKRSICSIPMSQPYFFMTIVLIWSLRVLSSTRVYMLMTSRLFLPCSVKYTAAYSEILEDGDDGAQVIAGMPLCLKLAIFIFVLLPNFLISAALLYLGSRFLASDSGFDGILLDAIVLEFILQLPDLLYSTTAPLRTQLETTSTLLKPLYEDQGASCLTYYLSFLQLFAAIVWVLLYVLVLQTVLPDYKWDVRASCNDYLANLLARPA
uniref:Uncharacterized protein n=1 Tax=Noctiluca scintillans TaxID=2966 RepID=A0A7S0ZRQ2_NOCSC